MKLKFSCYLIIIFFSPLFSHSQVKLDLEFLAGMTLNLNRFDYEDAEYKFDLKNGYSYGVGFDLWLPNEFSISFGYVFSESSARSQYNWPYSVSAIGFGLGTLRDRIFYLGTKKKIYISHTTKLIPFVGIYYDPIFFESTDREYSYFEEFDDYQYYEEIHNYTRFNPAISGFHGALGGRIGFGIEKEIENIGRFSLHITYSIDFLKNVSHLTYASYYNYTVDPEEGELTPTSYYSHYTSERIGRNLLQVEFGFKMPCSMLFDKHYRISP